MTSVTATMDQNAQVVNTYRYKPYGSQLSKTGVGSDPSFQWVGSKGYRQTGKKYSDIYVRARHYDTVTGRWTSKDPVFDLRADYIYADGDPIGRTDRTGLRPALDGSCSSMPQGAAQSITTCIDNICKIYAVPGNDALRDKIAECFHLIPKSPYSPYNEFPDDCLTAWCNKGKPISCNPDCAFDKIATCEYVDCTRPGYPWIGKEISVPACAKSFCGATYPQTNPAGQISFCSWWWTDYPTECPLSDSNCIGYTPSFQLLHELLHLCGNCTLTTVFDKGGHNKPFEIVAKCIAKAVNCDVGN